MVDRIHQRQSEMKAAENGRADENSCDNLTHDFGLPDFDEEITKQLR